jgi:hypothetical protein
VRLTPLSLCEASTAAIKPWGCWDSKSAPEILALTFKRHAIARVVNTWRTAAALRFNWCSLPHSTRTPAGSSETSSPSGFRCHDYGLAQPSRQSCLYLLDARLSTTDAERELANEAKAVVYASPLFGQFLPSLLLAVS